MKVQLVCMQSITITATFSEFSFKTICRKKNYNVTELCAGNFLTEQRKKKYYFILS